MIKQFLSTRRSTKVKDLSEPGPTPEQLREILTIGARVPDHGKLNPWYFIVIEGEHRHQFGKIARDIFLAEHKESATQAQLYFEETRFMQAPVVIAVISRIRESKIPVWEQILSAGACCYNICLAANAFGFGANWLTNWLAYDDGIQKALGLGNGKDNIAGFIYIGTEGEKSEERERPDMDLLINYWTSHNDVAKKGDNYNKIDTGIPEYGFEITQPTPKK